MKLRSSMINDFDICPARYEAIWVNEVANPPGSAATTGTNFHKWATVFFDVIERSVLDELHLREDIESYLVERSIKEDWDEDLLHNCKNFVEFEADHLLRLRNVMDDADEVWKYFVPYKREINFETERVMGTIDRVDHLRDGTLMIMDYKTGRPNNTVHRRQVTWYAHNANRIDLFDGLTVSRGSILWTREPRFWAFDFSSRTLSAINRRIIAMNKCKKDKYYPYKPSGLCPYCPIFQECPAIVDWGKYGI
ncbi:Dna2/Cas4 domain-containing protein [bacterium]|nr:MAG: Dna2/Cas4 domain-containing protein [bacterium]